MMTTKPFFVSTSKFKKCLCRSRLQGLKGFDPCEIPSRNLRESFRGKDSAGHPRRRVAVMLRGC
ncbi:MAG: hypothetical protein BGP04_25145 [Rhizobiales bacterium 62-17]|nr:MAG: hypothetical protein BGP04_25145 [Rhizobiales bacterium 62-17]